MRLVNEDVEAAGRGANPQGLNARDQLGHLAFLALAELMDQEADDPVRSVGQRRHQVVAAFGAAHLFAGAAENLLRDQAVQFLAVGDDQDTAVWQVLPDPTGEHDHDQALAGPLGLPNYSAFVSADPLLGGLHCEVLVRAGDLLDPRVEQDEVVDQLQKSRRPFCHQQSASAAVQRGVD